MIISAGLQRKIIYGSIENFNKIVNEQLTHQKNFTNEKANHAQNYVHEKKYSYLTDSDYKTIKLKRNLNNEFDIKMSKENFIKLLDIWFEAYVSPEVIQTRINKYLEKDYQKKRINEITKSYYCNQNNMVSSMSQRLNKVLDNHSQQVSAIQTTGLDFGIVTNSVSSAVLYDVMNNKEHQKQYNAQANPILKRTNRQLSSLKEEITIDSDSIYNDYKKRLTEYLIFTLF